MHLAVSSAAERRRCCTGVSKLIHLLEAFKKGNHLLSEVSALLHINIYYLFTGTRTTFLKKSPIAHSTMKSNSHTAEACTCLLQYQPVRHLHRQCGDKIHQEIPTEVCLLDKVAPVVLASC